MLGLYFADDELSFWYSLGAVAFVLYSALVVSQGAAASQQHLRSAC